MYSMATLNLNVLQEALAGNQAVLRQVVSVLAPVVRARAARVLLRRRSSAGYRDIEQELDDICQEVFRALFADNAAVLRKWDAALGLSLENFVGLVAEREAGAIMRSGTRTPWRDDPTDNDALVEASEPVPPVEAVVANRELASIVLDKLEAMLKPETLHLFRLLFVEDLEIEQIASLTQLSPAAIYTWRSRLVKVAREIAQRTLSEKRAVDTSPAYGAAQ